MELPPGVLDAGLRFAFDLDFFFTPLTSQGGRPTNLFSDDWQLIPCQMHALTVNIHQNTYGDHRSKEAGTSVTDNGSGSPLFGSRAVVTPIFRKASNPNRSVSPAPNRRPNRFGA